MGANAEAVDFAAVNQRFRPQEIQFREPLLYIQDTMKYTVSVGLSYLEQLDPTNLALLLAGSVIVTIPLVIVFLIAQPYFLEPPEKIGPAQASRE